MKLTRAKAKEEVVCQLRFVSLDETLDGSIPMPRLWTRINQAYKCKLRSWYKFHIFFWSNYFKHILGTKKSYLFQGNRESNLPTEFRTADNFFAHFSPGLAHGSTRNHMLTTRPCTLACFQSINNIAKKLRRKASPPAVLYNWWLILQLVDQTTWLAPVMARKPYLKTPPW